MIRIVNIEGKGIGIVPNQVILANTVIAQYPLTQPVNDEDTTYLIKVAGRVVTGFPWAGNVPHNVEEGDSVAHLINDGVCLQLRTIWPGLLVLCKDILDYLKSSILSRNCTLLKENGKMIATRRISIGQEVLFAYGWMYMDHILPRRFVVL